MADFEQGEPLEQDVNATEFDPFGEFEEGEESEGEAPGTTPPQTETTSEPVTQDDTVFDVPGIGHMTASEIRNLRVQQAMTGDLNKYKARLEEEQTAIRAQAAELQDLIPLRKLMEYPAVAREIEQALGRAFQNAGTMDLARDPNATSILDSLKNQSQGNPRIQELEATVQRLNAKMDELGEKENQGQIEGVFEAYAEEFPGIVTPDFRNQVVDKALIMYQDSPENLGIRELNLLMDAAVKGEIAARGGINAVQQVLDGQPKGTRLVTGHGTRKSAGPVEPNPTKQKWDDIERDFASDPNMWVQPD